MSTIHTPEYVIDQIYDELRRRIRHISIALIRRKIPHVDITEKYDLNQSGTPKVGETEYAFFMWECAILTAFRHVDGLSKEANLDRNIKRNDELKERLLQNNLLFRSVSGRYREAHWEKPVEEICFFVTNTDSSGKEITSKEQTKEFFRKVYLLAENYEQDSFLFTFPGANRMAFLIATNNNARDEFRGNIKFAGPLYTHVEDIGDWTECSDGRISFRLKGMIMLGGTGNKKIKLGEGNMFDIEGYAPDGLIVIRGRDQDDLKKACHDYDKTAPLIERYFIKKDITETDIKIKVTGALKELISRKCRTIGLHCSAPLHGSYVEGAKAVLKVVQEWATLNNRKFDQIVIVDIYGDYCKGK